MNLSDAIWTLHEGTRLGDIYPVESFKHVQEMLWVDSDLSAWESDDDELMNVHDTGINQRHPALMLVMTRTWIAKISQSTCSPLWSGYQKISLLEKVRRLQQPFMSTEMYSAVALRYGTD